MLLKVRSRIIQFAILRDEHPALTLTPSPLQGAPPTGIRMSIEDRLAIEQMIAQYSYACTPNTGDARTAAPRQER
jgi:hypothetical protein